MKKTISNAFCYMFKDEKWYPKLGMLLLLYLIIFGCACFIINEVIFSFIKYKTTNFQAIPTAAFVLIASVILILFTAIILFFANGFLAKCTQNVINSDETEPIRLAEWNDGFLNLYILGAKRSAAFNAISVLLKPTNILLGLGAIFLACIYPALDRIFCSEFKFDSFFAWKKAFGLISENYGLYFAILGIEIVFGLVFIAIMITMFTFKVYYPLIAIFAALYNAYLSPASAFLNGIIGKAKQPTEATV